VLGVMFFVPNVRPVVVETEPSQSLCELESPKSHNAQDDTGNDDQR
jgi:hypothetical protein